MAPVRDKGVTPARRATCNSKLAWIILFLAFVSVQFAFLQRWSSIQHLAAYDEDSNNVTRWAVQLRTDILTALGEQEQRMADMSADITSQLKEREEVLLSVGQKLQDREQLIATWQSKMDSISRSGSGSDGSDVLRTANLSSLAGADDLKSSLFYTSQRLQEREESLAKLQAKLTDIANFGDVFSGSKSDGGFKKEMVTKEEFTTTTGCNRMQDIGKRGRLVWRPTPGKYLLLMCSGGQLSNRLSCIRQHMLDAVLLNRTLIFPSRGINYDYENLLDLQQPTKCFGNGTFVTLNDYLRQKGGPRKQLRVDRFICHVHLYQRPKICDGLKAKYSQLGITFGVTEIPELRTSGPWLKYNTADFLGNFSYTDDIIAFGNMFGVGGRELRFEGSSPLYVTESCRYYLSPSPQIVETAVGFVNSYLGNRFMSVHLRRGDFFGHCMRGSAQGHHGGHACFHPMQQVANCLVKRLEENPGITTIYLATNGNSQELDLLKQLLALRKKPAPLVRLPPLESSPWAEPLIKRGLHNDSDVLALVEKTICVFSSVFYGTPGSTFSGDIGRLRDWWYLRSCHDGNICSDKEEGEILPIIAP